MIRCRKCGNEECFSLFLERYVDVSVVDGEIRISPEAIREEAYLPGSAVVCDICLSRDIQMPEDFREKFWAAYEKVSRRK